MIRQLGTNEEVMIEGSDWATESIFSSNGQHLAIWTADRFAVWDVPNRRIVLDRAADVGSVVFDHRGQRLAVSSSQGQVTVFDITSGGAQELEQVAAQGGAGTLDDAELYIAAKELRPVRHRGRGGPGREAAGGAVHRGRDRDPGGCGDDDAAGRRACVRGLGDLQVRRPGLWGSSGMITDV